MHLLESGHVFRKLMHDRHLTITQIHQLRYTIRIRCEFNSKTRQARQIMLLFKMSCKQEFSQQRPI